MRTDLARLSGVPFFIWTLCSLATVGPQAVLVNQIFEASCVVTSAFALRVCAVDEKLRFGSVRG